jgi:hypothetical protein
MEPRTRALPRRTKRIRYTEHSDDDLEYDSLPRRHGPSRSIAHSQTYREPSTDPSDIESSESESISEDEHAQIQVPVRSVPVVHVPTRQNNKRVSRSTARRRQNYREPSTDGSDLERPAPTLPATASRRRTESRTSTRHHTRSQRKATQSSSKSFALFKKRKPNSILLTPSKSIHFPLGLSRKHPPWQTLSYEALVMIMKYAAYPLYGKASRKSISIQWLCGVSLLCRSFHDAAVAALLHSPPLYPPEHAVGLINLLKSDQSKTAVNYRTKIKRLDIEVKNILINKTGIELADLLQFTPNLEHLRLYHNHDDVSTAVWAQPSARTHRKWSYPMALFDQLDAMGIRLKSFEWNGRFASPMQVLATMVQVHTRPCFSIVESMSLLNLQFPDKTPEEEVKQAQDMLVAALTALPGLKSLSIRTCSLIDATTAVHLPYGLNHLEITNNIALLASDITAYLSTRAAHLDTLILKHNQSMSLSFLSRLREFTPRLQHLTLDLSYTDPSSYQDSAPLFDEALPDGPPTWPHSLIDLSIEYLRQVSYSEANDFFASLVVAAPELNHLRTVAIKAIVNDADWRERAKLRKFWPNLLQEVFLDTRTPNKTAAPSLEESPAPMQKVTLTATEDSSTDSATNSKGRRSGRVQQLLARQAQEEAAKLAARRIEVQQRLVSASQVSSQVLVGDDPETAPPPSALIQLPSEIAKQGRCNVVRLEISDQRPAQDQYQMADFLDAESDDDGEYRQ